MRENNKLHFIFEIYSSKNTAEKQNGKQSWEELCAMLTMDTEQDSSGIPTIQENSFVFKLGKKCQKANHKMYISGIICR